MKLKEYMKYLIPLVIAIVTVFLAHIMSLSIIYGLLVAAIVFLISLIIILYLSYSSNNAPPRQPFLVKVYPYKDASAKGKEIELISDAEEEVKILGISHKTRLAEPKFLETLIKAGEKGTKITFLILNPNGKNLIPKAKDEGANPRGWENDIASSIIQFEQIKQDHKRIDLEIYTYDIFPIGHMVIIDDKIGLVGYYPTGGPGGSAPLYLIKKDKLSLLTPFIKYFNSIKDSGEKIIPKED
jgi:hypothetical protein